MTTARQRWYALHRARRVFARDQERQMRELVTYGLTIRRIRTDAPYVAEYIKRVVDLVTNPPIIVDPMLPDGGMHMYKPRKLPG